MAAFQKLEVISALPPKVGLLRLREVVGGIHRAVGTFRQHWDHPWWIECASLIGSWSLAIHPFSRHCVRKRECNSSCVTVPRGVILVRGESFSPRIQWPGSHCVRGVTVWLSSDTGLHLCIGVASFRFRGGLGMICSRNSVTCVATRSFLSATWHWPCE